MPTAADPEPAVAAARPVRALRGRARRRLRRARPADDESRAAAAGGHRDPRLRRLQQHARRGSRADPAPGREGRGDGVREAPAAHDPHRRGGVRRKRGHRAPADERRGGGGRRDPSPLGGRRHLARSGPLHLAQHDRRKAAADRRVGARERRRRGRHRVLRLVRDRAPLGRREHVRAGSSADCRGRFLGGRPRPHGRDRDAGGDGDRDRRVQRRDRARRGAPDRNCESDRRHVQPRRRRRDARADLRVGRSRARPRRAPSTR